MKAIIDAINYFWLGFKTKVVNDERGMGTIEIVIIIAVLVGLAFLFHGFATGFFGEIVDGIKDNTKIDSLFS